MCYAVSCKQCGKTTWAGCGQHVDSVKAGVPTDQWCGGHASSESTQSSEGRGLLSRIFGH